MTCFQVMIWLEQEKKTCSNSKTQDVCPYKLILYSAQKIELKNYYLYHVWKKNKNTRLSDPSGILS